MYLYYALLYTNLICYLIVNCDSRNFACIYIAYVDELPLANTPEVFGLHPNAEIGYYTQAVKEMLNHLIELQPQTGIYMFDMSINLTCTCTYIKDKY